MKIYLKYDFNITCRAVLQEQLQKLNIPYSINTSNELDIADEITEDQREKLILALHRYGITMLDDQKTALVERIKHAIYEMLQDENARTIKVSSYLTDKLNYSYSYLSTIFSEGTFSSIENYVILRKVDFVKDLLNTTDLTLTEIAYRLNYSSVAHLSAQFKKTTGLTPSSFQRIMNRRKNHTLESF